MQPLQPPLQYIAPIQPAGFTIQLTVVNIVIQHHKLRLFSLPQAVPRLPLLLALQSKEGGGLRGPASPVDKRSGPRRPHPERQEYGQASNDIRRN